jgi:hypothetical protein
MTMLRCCNSLCNCRLVDSSIFVIVQQHDPAATTNVIVEMDAHSDGLPSSEMLSDVHVKQEALAGEETDCDDEEEEDVEEEGGESQSSGGEGGDDNDGSDSDYEDSKERPSRIYVSTHRIICYA